MALRGRRIDNFVELWWLVASGVLGIWVSFTSLQKKWHRLASTASDKEGGKFQYDISWIYQINIFSKHQNKAEFKNLDDSKVLSRNFPSLRASAASMTSAASTTSMASMTFTASFHLKHYWLWWLDHPWHQNDQYRSLFEEWIIKNPKFHWY